MGCLGSQARCIVNQVMQTSNANYLPDAIHLDTMADLNNDVRSKIFSPCSDSLCSIKIHRVLEHTFKLRFWAEAYPEVFFHNQRSPYLQITRSLPIMYSWDALVINNSHVSQNMWPPLFLLHPLLLIFRHLCHRCFQATNRTDGACLRHSCRNIPTMNFRWHCIPTLYSGVLSWIKANLDPLRFAMNLGCVMSSKSIWTARTLHLPAWAFLEVVPISSHHCLEVGIICRYSKTSPLSQLQGFFLRSIGHMWFVIALLILEG